MSTQATALNALDWTCLAAGTVAAEVRQLIAIRLTDWHLTGLSSDVQLVAAELVANACEATPESHIRIRLTREPQAVLLGVWDGSGHMPQVQPMKELSLDDIDLSPENFDRNGGWGLQLVQSISTECGVTRTSSQGKWVWACFLV